MYLIGMIIPAIQATAVGDLQNLQSVITSAATNIGSPDNPNRSWGLLPAPGTLGTADLITNITTTVLAAQYNLNVNPVSWINATNATSNSNGTSGSNQTYIDNPYIDYVSAIPNLATALTVLGRAFHREMNQPVYAAIDGLQQAMTYLHTFSSSLLTAELIHSNSTIRTIRASSSLEDAQAAWSHILNLPGSASASSGSTVRRSSTSLSIRRRCNGFSRCETLTRTLQGPSVAKWKRGREMEKLDGHFGRPSGPGGLYTHKDLWGRDARGWYSKEGLLRLAKAAIHQENDAVAHDHDISKASHAPKMAPEPHVLAARVPYAFAA